VDIVDDAAHTQFDFRLGGSVGTEIAIGIHGAKGEGADGGADDGEDNEAGDEFEEGKCAWERRARMLGRSVRHFVDAPFWSDRLGQVAGEDLAVDVDLHLDEIGLGAGIGGEVVGIPDLDSDGAVVSDALTADAEGDGIGGVIRE